jgi:hypothetical protein
LRLDSELLVEIIAAALVLGECRIDLAVQREQTH